MSNKETKWIKSGDKAVIKLPLSKSPVFNRKLPLSTLFVGPYSHEFGHELFSFQGYARKLSEYCADRLVPYEKVIVACRDSMKFLYEDFATDFLSIKEAELMGFSKETRENLDLMTHVSESFCRASVRGGSGNFRHEQSFVRYGKYKQALRIDDGAPSLWTYDLIIHARRKKGRMSVNLSDEAYDVLFRELSSRYRVAFIGAEPDSHCPDGASDLRGIPLSELANTLASSRLVVGQSSGPIHFASLCNVPHLTWGGYRLRTFIRYAHYWNPFSTLCYLLESSSDGYIKNRIKMSKLPKDVLDSGHFNILDEKRYRHPPVDRLLLWIEKVINSKKLDEFNKKRMQRDLAQ
ncbi:hypothetical protein CMI37_22140 [Candidatus Pacearchaeota archaeon]|nr:hypothetical protein [Candidatus Pacearchaeota archaeon]|tara:strand:- start:8051 stop:9097 length:1047 start_codon:yes stop_codon:yes gene_type:complete